MTGYQGAQPLEGGACTSVADPDIFTSTNRRDIAAAKDVCGTCPLIQPCLKAALATRADGVWGGTTKDQRARLTRNAKRKSRARSTHPGRTPQPIAHGTSAGYGAHHRRGEKPCDECRDARNTYQAEKRKSRAKATTDEAA